VIYCLLLLHIVPCLLWFTYTFHCGLLDLFFCSVLFDIVLYFSYVIVVYLLISYCGLLESVIVVYCGNCFCDLASGRLTTYPRGCPRSEHEWFPLFHCIAVYCCLLGLFGFIVVYWVLFLFIVFYWETPHQLPTNSSPTLFGLLVCIVIYWV